MDKVKNQTFVQGRFVSDNEPFSVKTVTTSRYRSGRKVVETTEHDNLTKTLSQNVSDTMETLSDYERRRVEMFDHQPEPQRCCCHCNCHKHVVHVEVKSKNLDASIARPSSTDYANHMQG